MAGMLRGILTSTLILAVVSGCATTRSIPRSTCALIGGAIGGVSGVVVANNETEDETDENLVAAAIGALAGGLIGYLICGEGTPPQPPRASATATPASGEPPLRVQLAAQASDPDGRIVSYAWDFGDGARGDGAQTTHTYERPGRYAARVTVTDDDGQTASATANIDVAAEQAEEPAPAPTQRRIVLQGITFAFDSAAISETDAPLLDVAAEQLSANPDVRVRVVGHTDSVGADAYNQILSERRAASVVEYLTKSGVARSRLTASGAGEGQPVTSNETADGRAQNRRVELLIVE
jgi:OmpA-OmpF porin, OOP family